jgi:hypothetical protein
MGDAAVVDLGFSPRQLCSGVIITDPEDFGWEWQRLYTTAGKVRYFVAQIVDKYLGSEAKGDSEEEVTQALSAASPEFVMLARLVQKRTGCELLVRPGAAYVDHQSSWKSRESPTGEELFKDEAALERFLFDGNSCVQTGNDNSPAPWRIDQDRSDARERYELTYRSVLKEPPAGSTRVALSSAEPYFGDGLLTKVGALLCERFNAQLWGSLHEEGVLVRGVIEESVPDFALVSTEERGKRQAQADLASQYARGFSRGKGFWLSPKLEASLKQVGAEDPKDYGRVYRLTVAVSPALAEQLEALSRTSPEQMALVQAEAHLEHAQRMLEKALGEADQEEAEYWQPTVEDHQIALAKVRSAVEDLHRKD